MLRKLLFVLLFCIAAQTVFAQQPPEQYDGYEPIIEDPEPNWNMAKYSCPLSIKTGNGEHKFLSYSAAGGMAENGLWYILKPASRKHIQYESMLSKEQPFVFCRYENIEMEIIINANDAVACGGKGVCWTTDPYAGKK